MSLLACMKKIFMRKSLPAMKYTFTVSVDWKELAPTVLWALQEAYPDFAVLSLSSMEQLAAMYSTVPIEEGAAVLGQELSYYGYALYDVQTGDDESVFLLLPSDTEPPTQLYDILYKNLYCEDEEPEEAYKVDALLLLQAGKSWGQKAKRIRAPKLSIRLPESTLACWEMSSYHPKEHFQWFNARKGLLVQEYFNWEDGNREYQRIAVQVVNPALWDMNKEGVAHMFSTVFSHEVQEIPIDWSKLTEHFLYQYKEHLPTQHETLSVYTIPFMSTHGACVALSCQTAWFAVGAMRETRQVINDPIHGEIFQCGWVFDEEVEQRTIGPQLRSQSEVRLNVIETVGIPEVLSLPQVYPPPALQYPEYPEKVVLPQLPEVIAASYWVNQIFVGHSGNYWVDSHVQVDLKEISILVVDEKKAHAMIDALNHSRFRVLLNYNTQGRLLSWFPYSLTDSCWSRDGAWFFAPSTKNQGKHDAYLLRSIIDDSHSKQTYYTQVWRFDDTSSVLPQFHRISSHDAQLNGGVCHVSECVGLPASEKGFLLYGGFEYIRAKGNYRFSLNAINLDTGKAWQRSLQNMQPKWDKCRYSQRIHPKPLPYGWILLDIVGDNFGLTDAAWLWHMMSDRFFAIPLAAVTDGHINADFHYHPEMDCLFAYSNDYDTPPNLERLVSLAEMLTAIEKNVQLIRAVAPWVALDDI